MNPEFEAAMDDLIVAYPQLVKWLEPKAQARYALDRALNAWTVAVADELDEPAESIPVEFVTYQDFVANPEPQAEPLVTDRDNATIVPAAGLTVIYGTGGAGKTTLLLDAAVHWAAGVDWLDGLATPARPLRIVWIENEGPREEFRRKLERKMTVWASRVPADQLRVYSQPWAAFDLRDETHRAALAHTLHETRVDLAIIGPLTRLGMEGGGTPDEVRAFTRLLEDVQARAGRPVSIIVLHHENRAGQISGAWEGVPDLLAHVQAQGNGHTRVFWQKARWSSTLHGTTSVLAWRDHEGFELEDKPVVTEETIEADMLAAVRANPGASWTQTREQVTGKATDVAKVRDRLIATGQLVNTAARPDRFNLWMADDPGIHRSHTGTARERLSFPLPDGTPDPSPFPVPAYRERRNGNGADGPGCDVDENELERLADIARSEGI
jgi:hypothetical protein